MRTWLGAAVQANVQDFFFSEMRNGRCFALGRTLAIGAASGGIIQLMNPVGSGVEALVFLAYAELDIAQPWVILASLFNTQQATDVGAAPNLLSGGAASACHIRSAVTGQTVDGTPIREWFGRANGPGHELGWVCELAPGKGLILETTTPSCTLAASFAWREGV